MATTAIARMEKARLLAIGQNFGLVTGTGFFHSNRPTQQMAATINVAEKSSHQRRRADELTKEDEDEERFIAILLCGFGAG